jgi:hypothetical protein
VSRRNWNSGQTAFVSASMLARWAPTTRNLGFSSSKWSRAARMAALEGHSGEQQAYSRGVPYNTHKCGWSDWEAASTNPVQQGARPSSGVVPRSPVGGLEPKVIGQQISFRSFFHTDGLEDLYGRCPASEVPGELPNDPCAESRLLKVIRAERCAESCAAAGPSQHLKDFAASCF